MAQTLNWQIFDTSFIGDFIVYIVPTLTAYDVNDNLMTVEYLDADSGSFNMEVTWMCLDATDLAVAVFTISEFD